MKKLILIILIISSYFVLLAYEPFFVEDPAISPDGELITFVYMNDLWEVPYEGGVARRLTALQDRAYRPSYSPDGQWITFYSDRDGRPRFYRIPTIGGPSELITKEEFSFCDWFPDGNSVLGILGNPGEPASFIKYDFNGKRPLEITEVAESFASVSRDGKKIVFNRRGLPYRPAYQGSHNGDLWLYDISSSKFTRLTDTPLTERYPVFSMINPDRIYFAGSDSVNFQLYYIDNFDTTTKTQITNLTDWSARDISIARDNDRIVFEYFNEIWRYNPDNKTTEKVIIEIYEDNFPYPLEHNTFKNELTTAYISDDQNLLVFSHKFDLFAVPVKGGDVKQITFNQKGIEDIVIMDDNETIYFTSSVKGIPKLYKVNIKNPENIQLISWSENKYIQSLSKNKQGELVVRYDTDNERLLFSTIDLSNKISDVLPNEPLASMPLKALNSTKMIYTLLNRSNWNRTIRIRDIKSNTYSDIFFSTKYVGNLTLNETESHLFFNFGNDIHMVSLVNEKEIKENNWDKILKSQTTSQAKQIKADEINWDINFENFNIRRKELVSEPGFSYPLFATKDSTLFYIQNHNSNRILKKVNFDGSKREEVFNFRGNVSSHQLTTDQNFIYYILNNKLQKLNVKNKQTDLITFEYDYSFNRETLNKEIFEHVWGRFGHNFYDPEMHGQDWELIFETFSSYTNEIRDVSILQKIVDEMIGRVNASHTGYYPRSENSRTGLNRAYAGFVPDYSTRLPIGIRIKKIYHGSELAQKYNISENDIILEINEQPINAETEITPLFVNQLNKDISFRIQTSKGIVNATVKGISARDQFQLQYDDQVLNNYKLVQTKTEGRIGYLHIQGMNQPSLRKFEQDFLAVNVNTDGMIIDVRGNGGGNIHDDLVDIITRKQNAFTYSRYWSTEPRPTPHNIYQKPIVCLIDEDSFSDAEIFGVLFKDLNLGPVIGMPTSGSVIGTGSVSFMDGSSMRMPSSGWFRMNMENMELTGAKPDIYVPMLPEHIVKRDDPQLKKAIEVLLEMIK